MATKTALDKKVERARVVIARDGVNRAESTFGKNSPALKKALADREKERAYGRKHRQRLREAADARDKTKGRTTSSQKTQSTRPLTTTKQPTAAQQRVLAQQRTQARRNVQVKRRSQSQAQGQSM